jgi:hypothetical protein
VISFLEIILCVTVLVAAAISMRQGFLQGVTVGVEEALDILVESGELSRFIDPEGEIQVCSSGVMNNICPKCGFQEGDECESHT